MLEPNNFNQNILENLDNKQTDIEKTEWKVVENSTDKKEENDVKIDESLIKIKMETNENNPNDYFIEFNPYDGCVSGSRIKVEPKLLNDSLSEDLTSKPLTLEEKVVEIQNLVKIEKITFECTACCETFSDGNAYSEHMTTHQEQYGQDAYGVCRPRLDPPNIQSTSYHSPLITDNNVTENTNDESPTNYDSNLASPLPSEENDGSKESKRLLEINSGVSTTQTIEAVTRTGKPIKLIMCQNKQSGQISLNNNSNVELKSSSANDLHTEKSIETKRKNKHKYYSALVRLKKVYKNEKRFSCNLCEYRCSRKSNLVRHMRIHDGREPFSCKLCEFKCLRNGQLVKHMKIHASETPFSCKLCEYKCKLRIDLVTHMRTAHLGAKPFSCELCEYKCAHNSHLIRHMRTHTGEKPFSCNLCDYKCAYNSHLARHMTNHTGEKPFSCTICDYRCARKSCLVSHINTHTGAKPFSCKLCQYKCARKSDLASHMKTHTGAKPYLCNICEYKSARKGDLARHRRTHNSDSS